MGSSIHKKNLFFPFLLLVFSAVFFSCNQNVPQLSNSDFRIVFDYKDEKSLPDVHASLYSETLTDPRLLEKLCLKFIHFSSSDKNQSTGGNSQKNVYSSMYEWNVPSLKKIKSGETMYAGYSNIRCPEDNVFPQGLYTATFTAFNGEEVSVDLNLKYDSSFYTKKVSEIKQEKFSKNEYIVLYDENNTIIYYGEKTEGLTDNKGIWNSYNNAKKFRDIWLGENYNVMIVFPEVSVVPES